MESTMTSALKAVNDTLTTVLDTVSTTAKTVGNLIGTIDDSVDIASSFIRKHRTKQVAIHAAEMKEFNRMLKQDTVLSIAKREHAIVEQLSKDKDLFNLYQTISQEYDSL